jgi:hypothetical protein
MDLSIHEELRSKHGLGLGDRIGRGGFGEVYRATGSGGPCAVKISLDPIDTSEPWDADAVKQISLINFTGFFALNRAGSFTLQFTFTDPIGGQKSRFEVPLKVLEP